MEKITNKISKVKIHDTPKKRIIYCDSETDSEQQSESETSSVEKLTDNLNSLKIKKQEQKKIKITPFAGGISNKSYIKKPDDNSLDISQIFKNKQNIQIILKFLNEYTVGTENKIKCIILRGNIGCGKMTLIKACLKNTGYSNLLYDSDAELDDIFDNLLISIEAKGFNKLMLQKGNIKKAVIIRDIDETLKASQRTDFFKFINKSKNTIPILMTSSDRSIGTAREVPKFILQLDFEDPSITELVKYFSSDKISKSALEKIISDSKFDLRYITNIVTGFKHSKTKININKVANFTKDVELDTFSCIKYCADTKKTWEDKLIYSSLYTNSTVFHNYPSIVKQITGKSNDMQICSQIADNCCVSEVLINFSFENQYWDTLDEYYNSIGTIGPLELITKNGLSVDKLTYPSSNLTVYKDDYLQFKILEKESMIIKLLVSKYFNGNKFIGNTNEFQKNIKSFKYPIQAYKLANINTDSKKVNSFLREFKKKLVINDE